MSLAGILLSVLLSFFAQNVVADRKIEELRAIILQRQRTHTRLYHLFTSLVSPHCISSSLGPSLWTTEENEARLTAIFDNGIDPDPSFSGPIFIKLGIDQEGDFCAFFSPLRPRGKHTMRKETLLKKVEQVQLQFLTTKKVTPADPKAISLNEKWEWRSNWPKECLHTPSSIRCILFQEGKPVRFFFPLFTNEPVVSY